MLPFLSLREFSTDPSLFFLKSNLLILLSLLGKAINPLPLILEKAINRRPQILINKCPSYQWSIQPLLAFTESKERGAPRRLAIESQQESTFAQERKEVYFN